MRDDVIVDDDIAEWLVSTKAKVHFVNGYPSITHGGRGVRLHRFIMGKPPVGLETDHINRNILDNRRSNLRFVTRSENLKNRNCFGKSGIKGVFFDKHTKRTKPWKAEVRIDGKKKHLGYYATKEEAGIAVKPFITYE